jgi:Tfp pilus assembly protein PilV
MMLRDARNPRRGLILVAVLVCVLVLMMLGAALLKVELASRQSNRDHERRLEAQWLAESGLERARARLAADPSYSGETWKLSAADLGLDDATQTAAAAGVVAISVNQNSGEPRRKRVRVQADFLRDRAHPSRHSLELLINLDAKKTGATP